MIIAVDCNNYDAQRCCTLRVTICYVIITHYELRIKKRGCNNG